MKRSEANEAAEAVLNYLSLTFPDYEGTETKKVLTAALRMLRDEDRPHAIPVDQQMELSFQGVSEVNSDLD